MVKLLGEIARIIYILLLLMTIYKMIDVFKQHKKGKLRTDIGCFRAGCGEICGSEDDLSVSYAMACTPGNECYRKFGECIRSGKNCDWKPKPELAECLAMAGDFSVSVNPFPMSKSDCNAILEQCKKEGGGHCIKGYFDYCKLKSLENY